MAANPIKAEKGPAPAYTGLQPKWRLTWLAGAAAGNITLTGIRLNEDFLSQVMVFGLTEGVPNTFSGIADLTSEFNITANDTINNTGGTSTAAKLVLVIWYDNSLGDQANPTRN